MIDPVGFLGCLLCFLACLFRVLRKYISMARRSGPSGADVVATSPWKRSVSELTAAALHDPAYKRPREGRSSSSPPEDREEGKAGVAGEKVPVMRERIAIPVDGDGNTLEGRAPRRDVAARVEKKVVVTRERRRPARIVIPVTEAAGFGVTDVAGETEAAGVGKGMEEEGDGYCLASRKGTHRQAMEDGYGVISDISKQAALFGVFDGHGGRAAVDFVSAKLGGNILAALGELKPDELDVRSVQLAIKEAYLTTDKEFLSQGLSSGVCAATIVVKDGELHAANVGDCRAVLCRNGKADALTGDHRAAREDERLRIENSGGFVTCHNGVWRVQDSLAVSRAIGDGNLKEWVISEPETSSIRLTPDCEFLILASDGLWDEVTNQEAVDVVLKQQGDSMASCKELIEMSCRRGNRDDVTVMVVRLEKFMKKNYQSG